MTTTSNIFIGLSAWQASHAYSVLGVRRSNGGNAYQVIGTGTSASSGGPTGTGANITDGSVSWKYLAGIDYTSLGAWESSIPGTLTQPVKGNLWNCGTITTTAGTPYLTLSGHTTTSTNTITLGCAAGESLKDSLSGQTTAFAFSTSDGVSFTLPSSAGSTDYFAISDSNVIFDGLQFKDPLSTSSAEIITVSADTPITLSNCIFDGYTQIGFSMIDIRGGLITNCLIIDRSSSAYQSSIVVFNGTLNLVNCTMLSTTGSTTVALTMGSGCPDGSIVRNCLVLGYTTANSGPIATQSGAITVDHSIFTTADGSWLAANTVTDGGNNVYAVTTANQFVNSATDFRLKAGADALNAGTTDTTDIPSATDIAGTSRPQGSAWDVGAWELITAITATARNSFLPMHSVVSVQNTSDLTSARQTIENLVSVVALGQVDRCSATSTLFAVTTGTGARTPVITLATFATTVTVLTTEDLQVIVTDPDLQSLLISAPSGSTIEMLTSVATQTSQTFASSVNTLESLTARALMLSSGSFIGTSYLSVLFSKTNLGQSNQYTEISTIPTVSSVCTAALTTPASSLNTFEAISTSATATLTTPATERGTFSYSGSVTVIQWSLTSRTSILFTAAGMLATLSAGVARNSINFSLTGTAQQGTSISSIGTFAAHGAMSQTDYITAVNSIGISTNTLATQFDRGSGTSSFNQLTAAVISAQHLLASGQNTIELLTSRVLVGNSLNARLSIEVLSPIASAFQQDEASVLQNILTLSVFQVVQPFIQTENLKDITTELTTIGPLHTPGPPQTILLKADLYNLNAFQSIPTSATQRINFTAAGIAIEGLFGSVSQSINLVSVVSLTQINQVSGRANINLSTVANSGPIAAGRINILNLSVGRIPNRLLEADPFNLLLLADPTRLMIKEDSNLPQITQAIALSCLQSFDILSATGTALVADVAFSRRSINFVATGQVSQDIFLNASPTITYNAMSQSVLTTPATELANIDLVSNCFLGQNANASGTVSLPTITSLASVFNGTVASATGNIGNYTATGQAAHVSGALCDIDFTVNATASQFTDASATNTLLGITPAVTAAQFNLASSLDSITTTSTSSVQQFNSASATNTFFQVTGSGTGIVNGSVVSAHVNIEIVFVSAAFGQNDQVVATSALNFVSGGNGRLWVTPQGYIMGESLVYWSD